MDLYRCGEFGLNLEGILADMRSTWTQVEMDAARLSHPAPDVGEVLAEAAQLQQTLAVPEPPTIRAYLDDPRWGADKHWEDLARDLLRFFMDAYILPEGLIEQVGRSWNDPDAPTCLEASAEEIRQASSASRKRRSRQPETGRIQPAPGGEHRQASQ